MKLLEELEAQFTDGRQLSSELFGYILRWYQTGEIDKVDELLKSIEFKPTMLHVAAGVIRITAGWRHLLPSWEEAKDRAVLAITESGHDPHKLLMGVRPL